LKRKILVVMTCMVLLFSALAGCSGSKTPADISVFLFQSAYSGSYQNGILSLEGAFPRLFFVAHVPGLITGYLTTNEFIDVMNQDEGFKNNAPRATLYLAAEGGTTSVDLKLISVTQNDGVPAYKVQVLSGGLPDHFGSANLFIDAIPKGLLAENSKVLGDAPAVAMGNLYQATSQALANAAHNATQ
jgi:hypothetical protein